MIITRNPMTHYFALTAIFFLFLLILPANPTVMQQYNLSSAQYTILLLIYTLPFIGIWYAAFYAYIRMRLYADSIAKSPEAKGYELLAKGCAWLAYSLPVTSLVGLTLYAISNTEPNFKPAAAIISNYVYLILPLIGFTVLGRSTRQLTKQARIKLSSTRARLIVITFVILGLAYCYLSLRNFDLASIFSTENSYFLPIWLVILSLTIPYLYTWFVGLLAAYEMVSYALQSKGLLYRQALQYAGYGIAAVITSSIALQYIEALKPAEGTMAISLTMALSYIIYIITAIGYVLIAIGATKLKRIEEV